MKRLTLLRHAKSGWDKGDVDDFLRGLNPRGRRAAQAMGREMRRHGLRFDQVLASPAKRVIETLAGIGEGYGRPIEPDYESRLYLAPADTLLSILRETDDSAASLLLVGHSPGLETLALRLTAEEKSPLRDALAEKFPTAALAEISLEIDSWGRAAPGVGRLRRFVRPRDLDPELGPDRE